MSQNHHITGISNAGGLLILQSVKRNDLYQKRKNKTGIKTQEELFREAERLPSIPDEHSPYGDVRPPRSFVKNICLHELKGLYETRRTESIC